MCGRATLTMVASSTTISCAEASTSRARPGRAGPPPAVALAAGLAVGVALDRVWGMAVLLDARAGRARAGSRVAPYPAGAGLVKAAASGSRARWAIAVSP